MPTVGAFPVAVLPAMIDTVLVTGGRSLASRIVPDVENSIVFEMPGGAALDASMAALSDPSPLSLRLVTVKVVIELSTRGKRQASLILASHPLREVSNDFTRKRRITQSRDLARD